MRKLMRTLNNVYIVEMYDKHITGFTTYKQELLCCFNNSGNLIPHIISLRCPTTKFDIICSEDSIISYHCPGKHNDVTETSCALLALHIDNQKNNIFLFNFSPAAQWLKAFRKYFSKGKMVYVIHDFMWASFIFGDINKFYRIIGDNEISHQSILIKKIFQDGKETFNLADRNVCLSDDTYYSLQKAYGISTDKIVKIYNGLHDYTVQNILPKASNMRMFERFKNNKILLYVGRVSLQKGAIDLINSFATVVKYFPKTVLVIAAEFESMLLQKINDEIRGNLVLLGTIPHKELCHWYQVADWGVIPSYYEQCSYTGIEMKMFGLPIISSNGYGVRNMFNPQNSIIAHVGKINTCEYQHNLATAIIKALSLPESQVEKIRQSSKRDYIKRYNIVNMFNGYFNLLSEISK